MNKKVLVAMSGGVDSSVAALLLKKQGYDVVGVTMQIFDKSKEWGGCCSIDSVEDARRVAHKLDIPHYVLNFRDIFEEKVIKNFCEEYKAGRTPNPCVRCNQYIKFDEFLKKADEIDADYIATGHYARIVYDKKVDRYLLKRGVDNKKDQSYFLYVMTQKQLSKTLFPVGHLTKEEVRRIAEDGDLPVAHKEESQEICFVPDDNYANFLKQKVPEALRPGPMTDIKGNKIAEHKGLCLYTIGQRKGLGVSFPKPQYVVDIKKDKNEVVVGDREDVFGQNLMANELHLVSKSNLDWINRAFVKIRYAHKAAPATVTPIKGDKFQVQFDAPQWAVTPGQAVVFYDGDTVIGGGTISARV
ncbi:tRNA 2-thiouridine(34) synthase MnmA [bacterium]|nr:tRNA 2-thiouridine(34) synthase MnmA [bacterium]